MCQDNLTKTSYTGKHEFVYFQRLLLLIVRKQKTVNRIIVITD